MKAIIVNEFGAPEVLKLEDIPDPKPGPGEVVVRVRAVGVNPLDTYMRAGTYGVRNPALPYTPGTDAAGTVESLGPSVDDLATGDRVYIARSASGTYAELTLCKREQVHLLPLNVGFSQGAAVYTPYVTAYRALFQLAHAKPGETVLVHGASGGVGIAAVQWAHAHGMKVIGTAGSDDGIALVVHEGADLCLDHRASDYQQQILAATGDRGVDVILEMLANVNLGNDLKLLAQCGRVVVIGSRGDVQITPRDIMSREAMVMGMTLWLVPEAEGREIHSALNAGLRDGTLRPQVGLELPLAQAAQAHHRIMEPGALGKIALIP
jgi:NADPH2:quinone reductase